MRARPQMLVTAEEALIPNSDLPDVAAFAVALSKRLKQSNGIVHTRSVEARACAQRSRITTRAA